LVGDHETRPSADEPKLLDTVRVRVDSDAANFPVDGRVASSRGYGVLESTTAIVDLGACTYHYMESFYEIVIEVKQNSKNACRQKVLQSNINIKL
jgi:hypothetical protein